jgi:hypothetical protein
VRYSTVQYIPPTVQYSTVQRECETNKATYKKILFFSDHHAFSARTLKSTVHHTIQSKKASKKQRMRTEQNCSYDGFIRFDKAQTNDNAIQFLRKEERRQHTTNCFVSCVVSCRVLYFWNNKNL